MPFRAASVVWFPALRGTQVAPGAMLEDMARVVNWNGKHIPPELRELPPGRYVIESVDLVPELTVEDEQGLEAGLASLRRGDGISAEQVHAEMRALIGTKTSVTGQRRKR